MSASFTSEASNKRDIKGIILNVIVSIFAVLWIYPFYLMFILSFRDGKHVFDFVSLPNLMYFENYLRVFKSVHVFSAFFNSIKITASTMILAIMFASMAGYVISRSKEKFFTYVYLLFACGLIIPAQTSMIPIYKIGVYFKLINQIPFLIMIYLGGLTAFGTLIYTGFTKNIPIEIEESAKLDGCGIYGTFFRIVFPLLRPATGTFLAVTIYWIWNDFSGPLIYLNNANVQTIVMAIFNFQNGNTRSIDWGPTLAICFISSVPMIVFFLFTQKYLLKGLTAGAVKG